MTDEREKVSQLVKAKTSSLQKRASNIVSRGLSDLNLLKDTTKQKTIIFVYRNENVHLLFTEEVGCAFGNKINIVHFYSPIDAFDYLISNKVDLVVSEIVLQDIDGITFLNAVKTLYQRLPFIIYCAFSEVTFKDQKPDYYIVFSADFLDLLKAIEESLNAGYDTEIINSNIKAGVTETLLNLSTAHKKFSMHQEFINNSGIAGAYYSCLGDMYRELGRLHDAMAAFKQATEIQPVYAYTYLDLGRTYSELDMHKEAIEAYKEAVKIKPSNAYSHFSLGVAYYNNRMYESAIQAYNKAIDLNQNNVSATAYNNRGLAYEMKGNVDKAISDFKKACEVGDEKGCENLQKILRQK